jgi:ribosomal protein S18 acetylase RimI-like enzyme
MDTSYKTWLLTPSTREVHVAHPHGKATGYFVTSSRRADYVIHADEIDTDVYDAAIETWSRHHIHRFAYLQFLEVEPKYRRNGVGGILLEAFVRVATRYEMQVVTLFANPDRARNQGRLCAFYGRHGFENPIDRRASMERWIAEKPRMKENGNNTLNQIYLEARRKRHAEDP